MDRYYILAVIERIEQERSVHEKKFQGNAVHRDCLPRFEQTIARLRDELKKFDDGETQKDGVTKG